MINVHYFVHLKPMKKMFKKKSWLKRKPIIYKHRTSCFAIFSCVQEIVQVLPFKYHLQQQIALSSLSFSSLSGDKTAWFAPSIRVFWASVMIMNLKIVLDIKALFLQWKKNFHNSRLYKQVVLKIASFSVSFILFRTYFLRFFFM